MTLWDYICASRRRFNVIVFILIVIYANLTMPDDDWIFECDNGNFVEGEKVRDGIYDDCGDWSDEFDIGNSYWAGNRASDEKRDFEQWYEDAEFAATCGFGCILILWYIGNKTIVFGSTERTTLSPPRSDLGYSTRILTVEEVMEAAMKASREYNSEEE